MYMIEYHTIFILKKTDRFFKTFRSPLPENSAGAADEAPLRSCGSPCIAPSWGDAKCFGGGKTHEIRILTQLCAGQRAKIWRRGKDFFGKSSLKNAHFCYNRSKVPLCGGGLLYCGPLFRPAPGPIGFNEERKMGETILELQNIAKHFGDTDVLNGISISIGKGEFITLLGPSGCGKTTTLRIIAGLETPDEGRVILNGQDVTDSEPNKRDVNTVFQNYALFPHMTVAANIGYSLKLKKRPKDEIKKAVDDALALVQLSGYGKRMPAELSGGQRQRVAIARAVVNRPSVLLLDEPLGALDLQLRRQMQLELKALQKQLGITFIYITHDQEEALNMSDRIAVMKDGRFEQLGTPAEVYDSPRTSYVARFVGTANVLTGTVEAVEDDVLKVACAGGCAGALRRGYSFAPGAPITLAVRSEHVEFTKDPAACGIAAVIREKTFAGGMLRIALELSDGTTLIASRHGIDMDVQTGDAVRVTWAPASAVPVDVEAEEAK